MQSRDPRAYVLIRQRSQFREYDDDGFLGDYLGEYNKTFWLKEKNGGFKRRYSTESAPEWVMQIYNRLTRNEN